MKLSTVIFLLTIGLLALSCNYPAEPEKTTAPVAGISILATTVTPSDVTVSGGYQAGHFPEVWDLTAGDMTLSFTYDATGMVDVAGAHAWAEFGVRSLSTAGDFNPDGPLNHVFQEQTVDLFAGQNLNIGHIVVWIAGGTLYIKYVITEPCWTIMETHLAFGGSLSDIPQGKNGNPIPGQFPKYTLGPDFVYAVPLSSPIPDPLYIAVHAEVVCGDQKESAWAGAMAFEGSNWATYFTYASTSVSITGSGVWLATDYDYTAGTFDPDPVGSPSLDLDDKLLLQKKSGQGEGAYNLPSTPPSPGNNHRFWWDRDGVDPWQNDATANTGGLYQVIITLHATGATEGTAYMNIRGLNQGFETDGNWSTIELTPAGMTFVGDMKNLVVFYGIYGYGATHSATFTDITINQ